MRSLLFWDVTQGILVLGYRRFGTTCRYHLRRSSSVSFPIFSLVYFHLPFNLCRWSVLTSGLDDACEILKCGMIYQCVLAWSNDVMNLTRGVSRSWEETKPLSCMYYEVKNAWTNGPTSTSPYFTAWCVIKQWHTEGGLTPPPEIPKFWQSRTGLQIERKMFSVHIATS